MEARIQTGALPAVGWSVLFGGCFYEVDMVYLQRLDRAIHGLSKIGKSSALGLDGRQAVPCSPRR